MSNQFTTIEAEAAEVDSQAAQEPKEQQPYFAKVKRVGASVLQAPRPEFDFVLPGLPVGKLGVISGMGAVGKTMFSLQLAASVSLGKSLAGDLWGGWQPTHTGKTICLLAEDDHDILAQRMYDLCSPLSEDEIEVLDESMTCLPVGEFEDEAPINLYEKLNKFGDLAKSHFTKTLVHTLRGHRLAIIDPLTSLLEGLRENENSDVAPAMRLLRSAARESGCAIVVLHHSSKSDSGGTRGASAIRNGARWVTCMRPASEEECIEFQIDDDCINNFVCVENGKANYGRLQARQWLRRDEQTGLLAATSMGRPLAARKKYSGGSVKVPMPAWAKGM